MDRIEITLQIDANLIEQARGLAILGPGGNGMAPFGLSR